MSKLIIALDNMNEDEIGEFVKSLSGLENSSSLILKVNDLLADIGFAGLMDISVDMQLHGDSIANIGWMIDGKWNDIPNTVANYIKKLSNSGLQNVEYLTVMASGGYEMMKKAVETKNELGLNTKILAVTVLTSMTDDQTYPLFEDNAKHSVLKLAKLALEAGVDGLVCSPNEAGMLRVVYGSKYSFELVTPGIRFETSVVDDQSRVSTPSGAINNGSTHLVVGRPITGAEDKVKVINEILSQISSSKYIPSASSEFEFEKILYTGTWEDILKYIGAIYMKPQNGKYVRYTSGLIADGYINVGVVERNFRIIDKACFDISNQIKKLGISVDVVMGAQMGSVRISLPLAKSLNVIPSIYAEKPSGDLKQSELDRMELKRHYVDLKGKKVLLSEDVVTKGSTVAKMKKMVEEMGGEVIGVATVINYTQKDNFEGVPIFSCYSPKPFNQYWDDNTPETVRADKSRVESGATICEKPKNNWKELVESMRA